MDPETQNVKPLVRFLESERLIFRPLEEGDAEAGYRWINDPDIRRYLVSYLPVTFEEERQFMRGDKRKGNEVALAMIEKSTGRHIGGAGLHNINWRHRRATFGFLIGEKDSHGKGYGTEAMRTILGYAFGTLNLAKVKSVAAAVNTPSIRCHQKCGFVRAGYSRREFFVDGNWEDMIVFEIFAEDWFKQNKEPAK